MFSRSVDALGIPKPSHLSGQTMHGATSMVDPRLIFTVANSRHPFPYSCGIAFPLISALQAAKKRKKHSAAFVQVIFNCMHDCKSQQMASCQTVTAGRPGSSQQPSQTKVPFATHSEQCSSSHYTPGECQSQTKCQRHARKMRTPNSISHVQRKQGDTRSTADDNVCFNMF